MNKKKIMLSKSRFLSGLQCHLRLRYSCFNRNLASETSYAQQAIFDMGHEVGELATRLYPGGILIEEDHLHHEEAVQTTLKVMRDKKAKSIFIYTRYEKRIIKELSEHFPQFHDEFVFIRDRFKDLHALIKQYFYQPGFHGSFSIKSVLPTLVPDMDYGNLPIQEGTQASLEYIRMIDPSTSSEEKQKIREELLRYCGHDTLAMVKIREEILNRF